MDQYYFDNDIAVRDTCLAGYSIQVSSTICASNVDSCCSKLGVEDKYNCMEVFGVPKPAEYCLEALSSTAENYNYREKNKY